MGNEIKQAERWAGDFGKEYTDRMLVDYRSKELRRVKRYGMTRVAMNEGFIGDLDRGMKILDVGCGAGAQLKTLQDMGFYNLYGVDIQGYAIEKAKGYGVLSVGSVLDLPFKDTSFDMVMTSGLLIHIPPDLLLEAMGEMYRVTKKYIWCFEYYSLWLESISYHGHDDMLWKADYVSFFRQRFPDLTLVKEQFFSHDDNQDTMFLLEKK